MEDGCLDADWINTEENEAREFIDVLVETVVKVTDGSQPSNRKAISYFDAARDISEKSRTFEGVDTRGCVPRNGHGRAGRECAIQGITSIYFIKETKCGKTDCAGISRSFEETNMLDLHYPQGSNSADTSSLLSMLRSWAHELLQQGTVCPIESAHLPQNRDILRPFAILPQSLMVRFNREGLTEQRMCHVELPELLDLNHATGVVLPSNVSLISSPSRHDIYRLSGIVLCKQRHYVAQFVIDGEWICLDGIGTPLGAVVQHLQCAVIEGWLVAFTIYHRQHVQSRLPNAGAEGHALLKRAAVSDAKAVQFLELSEALQTYAYPKATNVSRHRQHFSPEAVAICARLHFHCNFAKATGATVETCREDFASQDLQQQYRAVHPLWCEDHCDTFSDITAHRQSAHATQTPSKFTWSQCKTVFASQKELDEHMTTHKSIEARERRLADLESQLARQQRPKKIRQRSLVRSRMHKSPRRES